MQIKKRIAALSLLAAFSPVAYSLGLGEANVRSYLNQPLHAEITLVEASAQDAQSLSVGMAKASDYELLGLTHQMVSVPLQFNVEQSSAGPIVSVRSSQPIRDPIVRILLEVNWANGRMLREYTLLLDPLTYEAPKPQVNTASVTQPSTARQPVAARPAAEPRPRRSFDGDSYGPVRSGETLWQIAASWAASSSTGVHENLLAIYRLNPDAFLRGNLHGLKRGAVLRMPSASDLTGITEQAARREIGDQWDAWRQRRSAPQQELPTVSSAGRTEVADASDATADAIEPRLELAPPSSATEAEDAAATQAGEDTQEMAVLRQENAFLSQKIAELESALTDSQSSEQAGDEAAAISIQDATLARLVERLKEQREALAEGSAETPDPEMQRLLEAYDALVAEAYEETTPSQALDSEAGADGATSGDSQDPLALGANDSQTTAVDGGTDSAAVTGDGDPLAADTVADVEAESAVDQTDGTTADNAVSTASPDPVSQADPWYKSIWVWVAGLVLALFGAFAWMRGRKNEYDNVEISDLSQDSFTDQLIAKHSQMREAEDSAVPDGPNSDALQEAAETISEELDELDLSQTEVRNITEDAEAILDVLENEDDDLGAEPGLLEAMAEGIEDDAGAGSVGDTEIGGLDVDTDELDAVLRAAREKAATTQETGDLDELELDDSGLIEFEESTEASAETDDKDPFDESLDVEMVEVQDAEAEEETADEDALPSDDDTEVKLDLARAYLSMGDREAGRAILEEVLQFGDEKQQQEARSMLDEL